MSCWRALFRVEGNVEARRFLVTARGVFNVVALLGALWLYLLVWRWRRSAPDALTAAAAALLS